MAESADPVASATVGATGRSLGARRRRRAEEGARRRRRAGDRGRARRDPARGRLPRRHRALGRGRARALQGRHLPPRCSPICCCPGKRRRAHQDGARGCAGHGDRAHHRPRDGEDRGLRAQARRQSSTSRKPVNPKKLRERVHDAARRPVRRLPAEQACSRSAARASVVRRHDGALARHAQRVREGASWRRSRTRRCSSPARAAPARSWWRARSTSARSAPTGRSSPCTPARFRAS